MFSCKKEKDLIVTGLHSFDKSAELWFL